MAHVYVHTRERPSLHIVFKRLSSTRSLTRHQDAKQRSTTLYYSESSVQDNSTQLSTANMFIALNIFVVFVSSSFGFPTGQNQHLTTRPGKSPSAEKLFPLQLQPVQDETKRNLQTIIKLHEEKGQTLVIQIKSRGTRRARRSRRSSQRSRRRRKMPLCMKRCLRLGMLHPAQCHSLCN